MTPTSTYQFTDEQRWLLLDGLRHIERSYLELAPEAQALILQLTKTNETYYGDCDECATTWTTTEADAWTLRRCPECGSTDVILSDEPPGAGADPFGRPDPRTHPEFWTE